ncbi:phosphopantetheine-binding protein [Streptomyces enissocaesilis]|uniref:Carrier domain-containing protein n=1 Tax=Streptomyces enissocaesilis TaxID=332589 RepID=A0ABP6K662_9ACTN
MSASYPVIVDVLTESFGVDPDLLHPEATLEALDLDSLSLLELVLIIEERTGRRPETLSSSSSLAEVAVAIDGLDTSPAAAASPTASPTAAGATP